MLLKVLLSTSLMVAFTTPPVLAEVNPSEIISRYLVNNERAMDSSVSLTADELLQFWWHHHEFPELTSFICYSLPAAMVIGWGLECLKTIPSLLKDHDQIFHWIHQWVYEPSSTQRIKFSQYIKSSRFQSSIDWLAGAVFWQQNNIVPKYLYAHCAAAAIQLAALSPEKKTHNIKLFRLFLTEKLLTASQHHHAESHF